MSPETKRHLRILNVEDSESDSGLILRHVARAGFTVTSERVETAEEMRSALQHREWDLIRTDYSMPRFSGIRAVTLLHETGLDIPIIIISGTIGEDLAVE